MSNLRKIIPVICYRIYLVIDIFLRVLNPVEMFNFIRLLLFHRSQYSSAPSEIHLDWVWVCVDRWMDVSAGYITHNHPPTPTPSSLPSAACSALSSNVLRKKMVYVFYMDQRVFSRKQCFLA